MGTQGGRGREGRGAHGSVFMVHDSQFTVHSSRFAVHGSRFTVHDSRFTDHDSQRERGGREGGWEGG